MEIITLWLLLETGQIIYEKASIPECEEIGARIMTAEAMGFEIYRKTDAGFVEVKEAGCKVFELTASVGPCQDEDDA